MTRYLPSYLIAFVIFLAIDAIWLGLVARNFYMSRIGALILDQPRWGVAFAFYALYVVGLTYFAVSTGFTSGWKVAAMNGGLFGFFAYLTYNATNLATMKGYDTVVAVGDTLWGAVLGAVVAGSTVLVANALNLAPRA